MSEQKNSAVGATYAAIGCLSWVAVLASLIGLFALARAVFF